MVRTAFTRKDLIGGRFDVLFWIVGVLGSTALFLYGLFGFQWLNQRDPDFVRLLAMAYSVGIAILFIWRKSFFPWWSKAPALGAASLIGMAVPFGFVIAGSVLVGNGALDSGRPTARQFIIVRKTDPADSVLAPASSSDTQAVDLHVGRKGWRLEPGNLVELSIKPGFFHKPWIKDYRLVRNRK